MYIGMYIGKHALVHKYAYIAYEFMLICIHVGRHVYMYMPTHYIYASTHRCVCMYIFIHVHR